MLLSFANSGVHSTSCLVLRMEPFRFIYQVVPYFPLSIHDLTITHRPSTPGGWETFLAYEDAQQDILIGLLRLRKCAPGAHREELKHGQCSIVRELHVYGSAVRTYACVGNRMRKVSNDEFLFLCVFILLFTYRPVILAHGLIFS